MLVSRKPLARTDSSDAAGKHGSSNDDTSYAPTSQAIAILVMGLTGAGKSTFISRLTEQDVEVGHSLESCTTEAMGYFIEGQNGQKIYLIDTPGFDDTHTDDAKVFREIASILCTICDGQPLSIGGIIYIHRITDMRMAGTALKSLRIFEKICGEDCYRDVTIVTTMWSMLRNQEAREAASLREEMLRTRSEFFGSLVNGGARLVRYEETRESALDIVGALAARQRKVLLKLQKEMMASERITLAETTAGRYLEGELANTRKRYEREKRELEEYENEVKGDAEMVESILEQKNEHTSRIKKSELDLGSLAVTRDAMRHERRERFIKVHTDELYMSNEEEKSAHVQQVEEELHRLRKSYHDQWRETKAQSEKMLEQNKRVEALERAHDEQLKREKAAKDRKRRLAQLPFMQLLQSAFGTALSPIRRTDSITHDAKIPKRHTQKSNKKNKRSKGRQSSKSRSKSGTSHGRHHDAAFGESQAVQDTETSESDEESDDENASRSQSPILGFPVHVQVGPKHILYAGPPRRVSPPPLYPPYQVPYTAPNYNDSYGHYGARLHTHHDEDDDIERQ